MKRIIALVLSLVMALSLCVPAWGVGEEIDDPNITATCPNLPVAIVNNITEKYPTVKATVNGWGGNATVKDYDLDFALQFQPDNSVGTPSDIYKSWHADYIVSADKDVSASSVALVGYYEAFCGPGKFNDGKWVALVYDGEVSANDEVRLVGSMNGITVNYEEILTYGSDGTGFLCGVSDVSGENEGTTITVELRLYEATGASIDSESGKYAIIGTYSYTFGGVATIGEKEYQTLQEAVNEIGNNETITVHKGGEHSVEVGKEISFTVQPDIDVTDVNLKIVPAIGYDMTTEEVENGIKYTFVARGVKVGDVYYKTLDEAVNAVADGGTITILKNGEYSATVGKVISFTVKNDVGATVSVNAADGFELAGAEGKYVVTVKKVEIEEEDEVKTEVAVVAPEVSVDKKDMTQDEAKIAEDIAAVEKPVEFNEAANTALAAAKVESTVTAEDAAEALYKAEVPVADTEEIKIVEQRYYDVAITDVVVEDDNTSIVLNITPMCQPVATTAGENEEVITADKAEEDDVVNAAVIGSPKEMTITETVEITIQIPEAVAKLATNGKLYVTHEAKQGTFVYDATVEEVGEDGAEAYFITFTNPHGFSSFTIDAVDNTVATVGNDKYTKLDHALKNVANGGTVKVLKGNHIVTVDRAITFTLDVADNVTVEIKAADGYTVSEWNGKYTVSKAYTGGWGGYIPSTSTKEPVVKSPNTFDAGIGVYVAMSVMAAAGSAVVLKKRED